MNTRLVFPLLWCVSGCLSNETQEEETAQVIDSATVTPRAVNDDFSISTTDACGRVDFIDFGPGDPSNDLNNDDYFVIHDLCADSHGILATYTLTRNDALIDSNTQYNGNGLAGPPVYWDPFPSGNVIGNDILNVTVCLVDGPNGVGFKCQSIFSVSSDG